jgi:hypothetical protein
MFWLVKRCPLRFGKSLTMTMANINQDPSQGSIDKDPIVPLLHVDVLLFGNSLML